MGDYNSARQIIAMAYADDYSTRNLNMRVQCNNQSDFIDCCHVIGHYNEFGENAIDQIVKAIELEELEPDSLNYLIGREGSPVIYIQGGFLTDLSGLYDNLKELQDEGIALFDELNMQSDGSIRIWYD